MGMHKDFPTSPHAILDPELRWFPADTLFRATGYEKLLPPLVPTLRRKVKTWRDNNYAGASPTSLALLTYWFKSEANIYSRKRMAASLIFNTTLPNGKPSKQLSTCMKWCASKISMI